MSSKKWDKRFMSMAHLIATWSRERGRRVGAVIVGEDNEVRSTGHNGFPRGVNDDIDHRHDRESGQKYFWSSHAEQNAIFNAARVGVPLKGCRIYVPWFPCRNCGKAIIQSGIRECIAYEPDFNEERWGKEFRFVIEMFAESGVRVRYMERLADLVDGKDLPIELADEEDD